MTTLTADEQKLIVATQAGLPIVARPFAEIAARLAICEADVVDGFDRLRKRGVLRRIAAAPNHYALGLTANGMTVWDVDDRHVSELGREIGALEFVTHCYRRPRALPDWPYNLFAMVHGHSRDEVEAKRKRVAEILGVSCRACDILYSTRILKKTGLRLSSSGG